MEFHVLNALYDLCMMSVLLFVGKKFIRSEERR